MAGFKAKSGPVSLLWLLALATATAAPEIDLQLVLDVLSSSFSLNSTGVNSTGLDTGAVSYTLSNLDKGNSRNGLDCADNEDEEDIVRAPLATRQQKNITQHGDTRQDPYFWMREDAVPEPGGRVMQHLEAENNFTQSMMGDADEQRASIKQELSSRVSDDPSAPTRKGEFYYYSRRSGDLQIHARRPVPEGQLDETYLEVHTMDDSLPEEVLLDENKRKQEGGFDYYATGKVQTSPDHKLLAWTEDTTGAENYKLRVKDIAKGTEVVEPLSATSFAWASNSLTLFYVGTDLFGRPSKVQRRTIGDDDEETVYEASSSPRELVGVIEKNDFIFIHKVFSAPEHPAELLYVPANRPKSAFQTILPAEEGRKYLVAPHKNYFYFWFTGEKYPNGEIVAAPMSDPSNQTVLQPESNTTQIESFVAKEGFMGVLERRNGLVTMLSYPLPTDGSPPTQLRRAEAIHRLVPDEATYTLRGAGMATSSFKSPVVRGIYSSLTTPSQVFDFNLQTGNKEIKKTQEVDPSFNSRDLTAERIWATSHDGTEIPISLVYRNELFKKDGSSPLLLDGYGSSQIINEPSFSPFRLSLLDRGFVFAIAHIRGSSYLGKRWYDEGSMLNKRNSFLDFIASAEHLVAEKYTKPVRLAITGASAGGLLVGGTVNMRPDLFGAAVMNAPLLDVVTTFSDPTQRVAVPLRSEYGNPEANATVYKYMLTYSPYDNVRFDVPYPHLLVTGGLQDSRVGYWEPAKHVAKIRQGQADRLAMAGCNHLSRMHLLQINSDAGHGRGSGISSTIESLSQEYAFILKALGLEDRSPKPFSGAGSST